MNKKAMDLSLNVIIAAAIAMVVLVVLIAIFTGRLGVFKTDLAQVSDTEVYRVQAMSSSKCVPSKEGIADKKAMVEGLSEVSASSQYNELVQQLINDCESGVVSSKTDDDNRDFCNRMPGCIWR